MRFVLLTTILLVFVEMGTFDSFWKKVNGFEPPENQPKMCLEIIESPYSVTEFDIINGLKYAVHEVVA